MNEQALKDRLKAISKEQGIRFNECWKKLLLERFLMRLSRSTQANQLIFKGGFLLAYIMEIGRETVDLDFLITRLEANENEITNTIVEIVQIESTDGFAFHFEGIVRLLQPHMQYPGYRLSLGASFGSMKDRIHIDVGTGDIVSPTPRELRLVQYRGKPLFEDEISLLVYPPETIFAEKLETVISKGAINSRMKDYHDLLLLTREPLVMDFTQLKVAIKKTFLHRGTSFEFIDFSEQDLKQLNRLWGAHRKNLGDVAETLNLPGNISDVIMEINEVLSH